MDASKVKAQPPVQAVQAPKRTEQTQKSAAVESNAKPPENKPAQEAKPRPTINAQGQRIGERLSVTA